MSWAPPEACFGKLWDPSVVECTGGPDPAYRASDGSRIREKCGFFEQCGATKQANAQAAAMPIPPNQLTRFARPVMPAPGPVSNPQPIGGTTQAQPALQNSPVQQQQQIIQQLMQQVATMQRGVYSPQQAMATLQGPHVPHVGYQQMMPVNFSIPQYLTVREERAPDGSIWGMLGREVVRSMGKSFGHTLANFFDATPFKGQ